MSLSKTRVAILISDKIDFKTNNITREQRPFHTDKVVRI
jgi:hypothetical protein